MGTVADEVIAIAQRKGKRLYIQDRSRFDAQVQAIPEQWTLEVTVKRLRATRSTQMNRFYWGVVLHTLSEHTGYTPDELHDVLKMKFIPKKLALQNGNGEVKDEFVMGGSTRKMNTKDFQDYIESIRRFSAEDLDCYIPDVNEAVL